MPWGDGRHAADGARLPQPVRALNWLAKKLTPVEPDDPLNAVCVDDLGDLPWGFVSKLRGVSGAGDGAQEHNSGDRGSQDPRRP